MKFAGLRGKQQERASITNKKKLEEQKKLKKAIQNSVDKDHILAKKDQRAEEQLILENQKKQQKREQVQEFKDKSGLDLMKSRISMGDVDNLGQLKNMSSISEVNSNLNESVYSQVRKKKIAAARQSVGGMRKAMQRQSVRLQDNNAIILEARRKVLETKNKQNHSRLEKAMRGYILKKSSFKDDVFQDGQFKVGNRIIDRATSSLCCKLTNKSKARVTAISLTENVWFDRFIMTTIIINSVGMALFDYEAENRCAFESKSSDCPSDKQSNWNIALDLTGDVCGYIFVLEAIIKIFALGFIKGKNTYLKSYWNVLDFVIVVFGLITVAMETIQFTAINLRVVRTLRILRPLKAMKTVPSLRKQASALISSSKGFVNVAAFLAFIYLLFALFGLQFFSGSMYYTCRVGEAPLPGAKVWQKLSDLPGNDDYSGICRPEKNQTWLKQNKEDLKCPDKSTCGSPLDFGLSLIDDGILANADIQYGISSFDDIAQSYLAVFQITTLDSWSVILYNLMRSYTIPFVAVGYCILVIFLGSFFFLNLMLAVVMESYMESEIVEGERIAEELQQEQEELEKTEALRLDHIKQVRQLKKAVQIKDKNEQKEQTHQTKGGIVVGSLLSTKIKANLVQQEINEAKQKERVRIGPIQEEFKTNLNIPTDGSKRKNKLSMALKESQSLETLVGGETEQSNWHEMAILNPIKSQIPQDNDKLSDSVVSDRKNSDSEEAIDLEADYQTKVKRKSTIFDALSKHQDGANDPQKSIARKTLFNLKTGIVNAMDEHRKKRGILALEKMQEFTDSLNTIPGVKQSMNKLYPQLVQAVQSNDRQEKLNAQKAIENYKNITLLKMQASMVETYKVNVQTDNKYGLKDEGSIMKNLTMRVDNSFLQTQIRIRPHKADKFHKSLPSAQVERDQKQEEDMNLLNQVDDIKRTMEVNMKAKETYNLLKSHLKQRFANSNAIKDLAHRADDIIENDILEMRAKQCQCYEVCLKIVNTNAFKWFIIACIAVNTITLATETYPPNKQQEIAVEYANLVFYTIFFVEMVLKLIAFGFQSYFRDSLNVFDFVIIVLSTFDLVLFIYQQVFSNDNSALEQILGVIQILRIFRLLKVFRLARSWYSLNYFLTTIGNAIGKIAPFSLLVYLFMFTCSILGMEIFSHTLRFNRNNEAIEYFGPGGDDVSINFSVPDATFNTFWDAGLIVFILFANDGWTPVFFNHYRANNGPVAIFYYVGLIVFGQLVLFNLFLAILLKEFDQNEMIAPEEEKVENTKPPCSTRLRLYITKLCKKKENLQGPVQNYTQDGDEEAQTPKMSESKHLDQKQIKQQVAQGLQEKHSTRSLCLFADENKFRQWTCKVIEAKWFDYFILGLIFISSVALALENPLNDPDSQLVSFLKILDYVTTSIFTLEIVIKVIALGFYFNGRKSYMKNEWNIVDFFIVVFSIVSVSTALDAPFIKIIRMARLLRPLRLISKNRNLQASIQALIVSAPAIFNLSLLVALCFFIFGIIGVNLFKGKSFYCDSSIITGLTANQIEIQIITKQDCLNYGGVWRRFDQHYDHLFASMSQMAVMGQTVNWVQYMYRAINANGPDLVPGHNVQPYFAIFFIVFEVIGSFFITNIFVGVVISAYNREQERMGKHFLLSDAQKRMVETKILVLKVNPQIAMLVPKNKCRQFLFKIAVHKCLDIIILLTVFANILTMCVKWPNMNPTAIYVTNILNYTYSVMFILEAAIKLIAFDIRYFKKTWHVFDFVLVIVQIIAVATGAQEIWTSTQLFRTLRLVRVVYKFKQLQQLQVIFSTFLNTATSLINVGSLMFLIIYIYAVISVNLFSEIKNVAPMNEYLNFTNIGSAFISLIRVATGESWIDLLVALGKDQNDNHECIQKPTFEDYKNAGFKTVGCGNLLVAWIFFTTYVFLITLIFLNLFVAIILNGYFETRNDTQHMANQDMIDKFKTVWSELDPEATGQIQVESVPQLLYALGDPLGWDDSYKDNTKKQEKFFKMCLSFLHHDPDEKEIVYFSDILDSLMLMHVILEETKATLERLREEKSINLDTESFSSSSDQNSDSDSISDVIQLEDLDEEQRQETDPKQPDEEIKGESQSRKAQKHLSSTINTANQKKQILKQTKLELMNLEGKEDVKLVQDLLMSKNKSQVTLQAKKTFNTKSSGVKSSQTLKKMLNTQSTKSL